MQKSECYYQILTFNSKVHIVDFGQASYKQILYFRSTDILRTEVCFIYQSFFSKLYYTKSLYSTRVHPILAT